MCIVLELSNFFDEFQKMCSGESFKFHKLYKLGKQEFPSFIIK